MKVPRELLLQLLGVTKREQAINGKTQPQVTGCVLIVNDKRLSTTSIVKDGKTSLSRFSFTCDIENTHTVQQNLSEWHKTSVRRAAQIKDNAYVMANGETRSPFATITVGSEVLYDALRCDGMNGQKLNRYTFTMKDGDMNVTVGDHFKGLTETTIASGYSDDDFEATFEGGLENILKYYKGNVGLSFLDFKKEGQGTRLIMSFDNGDWVFQAGVL
jgi:hypothetical protein